MADKDFKTIDEQIEILRSRGLTIEDEAEAKDFLLRNKFPVSEQQLVEQQTKFWQYLESLRKK